MPRGTGTNSIKKALKDHLDYICENTSCHGGNWALKTPSRWLKSKIQLLLCILQVFLVLTVIAPFIYERPISSSTKWKMIHGHFPNVTVCNSRWFSKASMKGILSIFYMYL